MRRVLTQNLIPGMKVGKVIFTPDGQILLGQGMVLKPHYIDRLNELEISSVYIEDEISEGIEINDVVSDPTRQAAIKTMKEIADTVRIGNPPDVVKARQVINTIIDELFHQKNPVVNLFDVQAPGDYLVAHMANVAVLSVLTGITLGYDQLRLRELGVGAFLHDVGMFAMDKALYLKPSALAEQEYETIQGHAEIGFEMVRQLDMVSILSSHVAFQHHERFDGKGYPRGMAGTDIHEFARITAVADVYDALTSDRPHRKAILPGHAVEYLTAMAGTQFDPEVVDAFINHIAVFPVGSIVELNTKEKAIVIFVDKNSKTRPVIRIFADAHYQHYPKPIETDLMNNPTLFISKVLQEYGVKRA